MANELKPEAKAQVVSLLCEGSSIRSIERITGIHRDTIMRLGVRVGTASAKIQDEKMRGLNCAQIEVDEIWGFVGAKCVFRSLSDSDSNLCRTGFRFLSDSILIPVGQGSGRLSDGFWAGLEWCPTGLERCPAWPGMVSDREWNPERKEWSDAGMGVRVAA
jgi:hypothetical protein